MINFSPLFVLCCDLIFSIDADCCTITNWAAKLKLWSKAVEIVQNPESQFTFTSSVYPEGIHMRIHIHNTFILNYIHIHCTFILNFPELVRVLENFVTSKKIEFRGLKKFYGPWLICQPSHGMRGLSRVTFTTLTSWTELRRQFGLGNSAQVECELMGMWGRWREWWEWVVLIWSV